MRILAKPLQEIVDIIGKQERYDIKYREVSFCIVVDVDGGKIMFNTLTKECIYVGKDDAYSDIEDELIKKWFLVPKDFDEIVFVDNLRQLYSVTKEQIKGYTHYTILTTTDCNARCFYCYQAKQARRTMSIETADKVVSFINRTRSIDNPFLIEWYGGEPLYNQKVINRICDRLIADKVEFESRIISNGYLFDKDTIDVAVQKWKLKHAQITIDGTEKVYNKVKAFIYKDANAYDLVLNNITKLLNAGVTVSIRINIDLHNLDDVSLLIDELAQRFKGVKGLFVYTNPLFEEEGGIHRQRSQENRRKVCLTQQQLNKKICSMGLSEKIYSIEKKFKYQWCAADNVNSIMVLPDGYLGKCNAYTDSNYVGHIDEPSLNQIEVEKFSKHSDVVERCKICPIYPDCIRLEMCLENRSCYKECVDIEIENIKDYLLSEYDAYKERMNKKAEEDKES